MARGPAFGSGARWVARLAAAVAIVAVGLLVRPGPAWAHAALTGTAPADGAVVHERLTSVVLTFTEAVDGRFTTVVVTGPDGRSCSDGPVRVSGYDVVQPVRPSGQGRYRVAWRAVSDDGHPVQGQFGFTIASASGSGPGSPTPSVPVAGASQGGSAVPAAAAPGTTGGPRLLPWLGAGAALLVVAGAAGWLVRRLVRRDAGPAT